MEHKNDRNTNSYWRDRYSHQMIGTGLEDEDDIIGQVETWRTSGDLEDEDEIRGQVETFQATALLRILKRVLET